MSNILHKSGGGSVNWLFTGISNTLKKIDTKSTQFRNYLTWAGIGALSLSIITYFSNVNGKNLLKDDGSSGASTDLDGNMDSASKENSSASKIRRDGNMDSASKENSSASKIKTKVGSKGTYIGEYNDKNQKHGKGHFEFENGDIYDGNWRENKRHGVGMYKWAHGLTYIGDWVADKRQGKGTMQWPDKSCYEGDFKNSNFHGNGVFKFADGSEYTGEWRDDRKNGYGKYTFASGNVYIGYWKNGKEHGNGKVSFQDGSSYEGEFYDGNFHGKGIKKWPDGATIYKGSFKGGKFHGHATVTYAVDDPTGQQRFFAGDVYEGQFANGHKSGRGLMKDRNGKVYQQGNYHLGKFTGQ